MAPGRGSWLSLSRCKPPGALCPVEPSHWSVLARLLSQSSLCRGVSGRLLLAPSPV